MGVSANFVAISDALDEWYIDIDVSYTSEYEDYYWYIGVNDYYGNNQWQEDDVGASDYFYYDQDDINWDPIPGESYKPYIAFQNPDTGKVEKTIYGRLVMTPECPDSISIRNVTSDSAQIKVVPSDNGKTDKIILEGDIRGEINPNTYVTISDLDADTTYEFEAYAKATYRGSSSTAVINWDDCVSDEFTTDEAEVYYTIKAAISNSGGIDSVYPADGEEVADGDEGYFDAETDWGYLFRGWYTSRTGTSSSALVSTHNPYEPVITKNLTLYARAVSTKASLVSCTDTSLTVTLSNLVDYGHDDGEYGFSVEYADTGTDVPAYSRTTAITYAQLKSGYKITGLEPDTSYAISFYYRTAVNVGWTTIFDEDPVFSTTICSIKATRTGYTDAISSVSPSSTTSCSYGETVQLSAALNDEYIFTGWELTDSDYDSYANPYNIKVYGEWVAQATAKECKIIFTGTTATSISLKTNTTMPDYYIYNLYIWDVTANKEHALYTAYTSSSFNAESGLYVGGLTTNHIYRFNIFYYEKGKESAGHWLISGGTSAGVQQQAIATAEVDITTTYNTITFTATKGTISKIVIYDPAIQVTQKEGSFTKHTFTGMYPGSTYLCYVTFTDGQFIQRYAYTPVPVLSAQVDGNTVKLTLTGGEAYLDTSWSAYVYSSNQAAGTLSGGTTSATFTKLDYDTEYIFYCSYKVAYGTSYTESATAVSVRATTDEYVPATYTLTAIHCQQNLALTSYTQVETTKHSVKEDSTITLSSYKKSYNGFTYNNAKYNNQEKTSITISGNVTVYYYYNRNTYTITVKGNNVDYFLAGTDSTQYSSGSKLNFLYEQEVKIQVVGIGRYVWESWTTTNSVSVPASNPTSFTMPYKNFELTAILEETVPAIEPWQWTPEETNAFTQQGAFSILTADRWNAFLDWCNTVIEYKGGTMIDKQYYGTQNMPLYASHFNTIVECIGTVSSALSSEIKSIKKPEETIYGWYFTHLAAAMNALL